LRGRRRRRGCRRRGRSRHEGRLPRDARSARCDHGCAVRIALAHNLRRSAVEEEAELDTPETIDALAALLGERGHDVVLVEASGPIPSLVAHLCAARAALVFNLAEGRTGRAREAFFPALYEQLGLPYTGSDAGGVALAMDK